MPLSEKQEDVIFRRGSQATIPSEIIKGSFLVANDTGNMYLDVSDTKRIQVKDDTKLPLTGGSIEGNLSITGNVEVHSSASQSYLSIDTSNQTTLVLYDTAGNVGTQITADNLVLSDTAKTNWMNALEVPTDPLTQTEADARYLKLIGGIIDGHINDPEIEGIVSIQDSSNSTAFTNLNSGNVMLASKAASDTTSGMPTDWSALTLQAAAGTSTTPAVGLIKTGSTSDVYSIISITMDSGTNDPLIHMINSATSSEFTLSTHTGFAIGSNSHNVVSISTEGNLNLYDSTIVNQWQSELGIQTQTTLDGRYLQLTGGTVSGSTTFSSNLNVAGTATFDGTNGIQIGNIKIIYNPDEDGLQFIKVS